MKILDCSNMSLEEFDQGEYLSRLFRYRNDPIYIKEKDREDSYKLILPKAPGLTLYWDYFKGAPIEYEEYEGGLYLGYLDNPHYFFIKPVEGKVQIIIPTETRVVAPKVTSNDLVTLIIKAKEIDISYEAFRDCRNLSSVLFEENEVVNIGRYCFHCCKKLAEVSFSSGKYNFGYMAFSKCLMLAKGIELPRGEMTFDTCCFKGCDLPAVYIQANVKSIIGCFDDSTKIFYEGDVSQLEVKVHYDVVGERWDGDPHHPVETFREERIEYGQGDRYKSFATHEEYEEYLKETLATTRTICPHCGATIRIEEMDCPCCQRRVKGDIFLSEKKGVLRAYRGEKSEVIVPAKFTEIESGAFNGANALNPIRRIVLPEGLTEIPSYFCDNLSNLEEIVLPLTLKKIGEKAFDGCPLKSISLPEGLERINYCAFGGCKLVSVRIPASVNYIGEHAFDCPTLERFEVDEANSYFKSIDGLLYDKSGENLLAVPSIIAKKITLPDSLRNIPERAFYKRENLVEIILPESLYSIGESAFEGCANLEKVSIPNSVTEIDKRAFARTGIKEFHWPKQARQLRKDTFKQCPELEKIVLPKTLLSIEWAIGDCPKLESIEIPGSVKELSRYVLSDCENLKEVIIGEGIEKIENYAIYECGIERLYLPSTLKSFSSFSFRDSLSDKTEIHANCKLKDWKEICPMGFIGTTIHFIDGVAIYE